MIGSYPLALRRHFLSCPCSRSSHVEGYQRGANSSRAQVQMPRRASSRVASSPWSNRREEATMESFNADYMLTMLPNPKRNSFITTMAGLRVTSSGRTVIVQIKGYLFFIHPNNRQSYMYIFFLDVRHDTSILHHYFIS
jgi:hypothetical protein